MSNLLTPQFLAESITSIVAVNPLFRDKNLTVVVIANEKAGGFKIGRMSRKNKKILASAKEKAEMCRQETASVSTQLFITDYPGHAEELAQAVLTQTIASKTKNKFSLIVTAGGDGTSCDVQTALHQAAQLSLEKKNVVMNDIAVLRLPLGTGNDGTDGHNLLETLEIIENPLHFANTRAIKLYCQNQVTSEQIAASGYDPEKYESTEKKSPWYSFNIAGCGIDAFVCYMTNKFKSTLPGNFYKLCVDLSCLTMYKFFPAQVAKMKAFDMDGNLVAEEEGKINMVTFGLSGHRQFGSGHKMFPVDENLAFINMLSVPRLVMENNKFKDGSYINTNLAKTYKAAKVEFYHDGPILFETDGETHLLFKEQCPLIMELTDPCVQVLESDSLSVDKGTVRKPAEK